MPDLNIRNAPDKLVREAKVGAAVCGVSLRWYVLCALKFAEVHGPRFTAQVADWTEDLGEEAKKEIKEDSNVSNGVPDGVRGDAGKRGKRRDTAGVRPAHSRKASGESGAVDGGERKDSGGKGKGKKKTALPKVRKRVDRVGEPDALW